VSSRDVRITGRGIYRIEMLSARAKRFARAHLSRGERTRDSGGALLSDDGRACREIVAALDRAGLSVTVNGQDMAGFGRAP
jgi:hypothetical protein